MSGKAVPNSNLLELSEKDFYSVVDQDVRGRLSTATANQLRSPDVIERFYQTLLRMKKTVEGTIAAKHSETKGQRIELRSTGTLDDEIVPDPVMTADKIQAEFLKWRAGSLRFKTAVEERLTDIAWRRKRVVLNAIQSLTTIERNAYAHEADRLRQAIMQHRSEIHIDDATEQDRELWATLVEPYGDIHELDVEHDLTVALDRTASK